MKKLYYILFGIGTGMLCAENSEDTSGVRVMEVSIFEKIALSYGVFDPQSKMTLADAMSSSIKIEILTFKQLRSNGVEVEIGDFRSLETLKNVLARNKTTPPIIDGWIDTPYAWIPVDLVRKLPYYTPGMKEDEIEDPELRKEYSQAIQNDLLKKLSLAEERLIQVLESYSALVQAIEDE